MVDIPILAAKGNVAAKDRAPRGEEPESKPLQRPVPSPKKLPRSDEVAKKHLTRHPRPWRRVAIGLVVVLVIVAAAGLFWRNTMRPITVEVAPVATNVAEQVFGLGTVGADVQSAVSFKVPGIISEIDANEGDHVKAGLVLARLDARDIAAQVAQAKAGVLQAQTAIDKGQADIALAEANLANAKAMSSRRQVLVKKGFASIEEAQTQETAQKVAEANVKVANVEVETARAGLQMAQAQQQFAEATLANYTLRAPYDAWVLARNLNLGAAVTSGQLVFTLAEPSTIWVVGYVDERLAGRLHVGQPAEIALRSDPKRRFPGHIARIEIQSDPVNEERLVDVAFDHLPPNIHLAEQAEVYLTTGVLQRAVLVPQNAVTHVTGDPGTGEHGTVWIAENGHLVQRPVTFGPQLLDGRLPVASELPEDARIVISPQKGLRLGRAVSVAGEARP